MKKIISTLLLSLICLSLVTGCSKESGILGHAKWEMTKQELIAAEGKENIVEGSSDKVLNWLNTEELTVFGDRKVSVGYVFTDDKLSSITVQIFLNEGETLADGMKATRTSMEKTYGESEGEDSSCHWHHEQGTIALSTLEGAETFFVATFSPSVANHSHE